MPDQKLLWVDANGLNERAKAVMQEIARADEYGLRPADYELPKPDSFDPHGASATSWLADAEVKISFAVVGYARDARGGRIDPSRLTENLDPTLALPEPMEVLEFDCDPLRARRLSAQLPAGSAAIRSLAPHADRAQGRQGRCEEDRPDS